MTLYDDLAQSGAHKNLTLGLIVEGIPVAFMERVVSSSFSTVTGRTQIACITSLKQGDAVLDMDQRREVAATLDVELVDDNSLSIQSLFSVVKRRATWIKSATTAIGANLSVYNAASLSPGQVIYIGAETVTIGTVVGTTLGTCVRGAFDSKASAITGDLTDGDSVYVSPPSWQGRRVFLYGYTPTSQQLLGVFVVDESPMHNGDRKWSLRLAGIAQEFFERPVGFGLQTTPAKWLSSAIVSNRRVDAFECENKTAIRNAVAFPAYVALESNGGSVGIYEVESHDAITGTLKVYADTLFGSQRFSFRIVTSARQIAFVSEEGGATMLKYLMLSREGQGATVNDKLPGRLPSTTPDGRLESGWSIGAGIDVTDVDLSSFDQVVSPLSTLIVDKESKLSDYLREFCILANCAVVTTSDGVLRLINLSKSRTSSTLIDGNSLLPDSRIVVMADEGTVYPYATIKLGYSPISGDYTAEMNLVDGIMAKRYPRMSNRLNLEFKSIGCLEARRIHADPFEHPADMPIGLRLSNLTKLLRGAGGGNAIRRLSVDVSLSLLSVNLGDIVTLGTLINDYAYLPDMRGGTLAGSNCRVVSRRPDYDAGRMTLGLQVLDKQLFVCPAAVIGSFVGTVLTLATTGPEVNGYASPGEYFSVGMSVRVFDISGATYNVRTVTAVSATTVTIDSATAFALQAGVDYIVAAPTSTGSTPTAPVSTVNVIEMASLANDEGIVAGTAGVIDTEPRWR